MVHKEGCSQSTRYKGELPYEIALEHILVVNVVVKVQLAPGHQGLHVIVNHFAILEAVAVHVRVNECVTGKVRIPVESEGYYLSTVTM